MALRVCGPRPLGVGAFANVRLPLQSLTSVTGLETGDPPSQENRTVVYRHASPPVLNQYDAVNGSLACPNWLSSSRQPRLVDPQLAGGGSALAIEEMPAASTIASNAASRRTGTERLAGCAGRAGNRSSALIDRSLPVRIAAPADGSRTVG